MKADISDQKIFKFSIDDWNVGKWIEAHEVMIYFNLSFSDCLKKFDHCRTVEWNPPPLNGQCIENFFRIRSSSGGD